MTKLSSCKPGTGVAATPRHRYKVINVNVNINSWDQGTVRVPELVSGLRGWFPCIMKHMLLRCTRGHKNHGIGPKIYCGVQ